VERHEVDAKQTSRHGTLSVTCSRKWLARPGQEDKVPRSWGGDGPLMVLDPGSGFWALFPWPPRKDLSSEGGLLSSSNLSLRDKQMGAVTPLVWEGRVWRAAFSQVHGLGRRRPESR
jgi:hypothetical protein